MTDRIAGWHRCWTNAQGRDALLDAHDTGITFPLRLLARTGQVIEQDTVFVAVHVFSFGSEWTCSRQARDVRFEGERPMASLYYEGCRRQRRTILFLSHFGLLCVIEFVTLRRPMCRGVPESRGARGKPRVGESAMVRVLNEILLYSGMAAFVTGIVVLAAATWIS